MSLGYQTYFVNGGVFLERFICSWTSKTGVQKGATMSLEDNKTVVRRFREEALVQGNLDVIDTCFAPNVILHYYNTPPHDYASLRKLVQEFHQAMAGHTATFHDLVAEGDTVAARFSYAVATHHAQFGNNPPTGQPFQL